MCKPSTRYSDPICLIACGTAAKMDRGPHVRAMWGLSARCCNTLPREHCASPEDLQVNWCKESVGDPELDSWNGITGNRRTWNVLKKVLLYTHASKKIAMDINYHNFLCFIFYCKSVCLINPLNPKLNPICYLLALLGTHHFLHVSRIRVKSLTLRWLMSYIYGAPIFDVTRSHTTTQHSR